MASSQEGHHQWQISQIVESLLDRSLSNGSDRFAISAISKKITISLAMEVRHSTPHYIATVRDHDICEDDTNLQTLYDRICKMLDELTAINWSPHLKLSITAGIGHRIGEIGGPANEDEYRIHFDMDIEVLELGKRGKDKFTRTEGRHIRDGWPEVGRETRGASYNALEMDVLDSLVEDTPANREALLSLAAEFQRLQDKMFQLFKPKVVQATLTGATTKGLLMPAASVEPEKKRKSKKI